MRFVRDLLIMGMLLLLLLSGCGKKPDAENPASSAESVPAVEGSSFVTGSGQAAAPDVIPIETVSLDGFSMNYFQFGHGDKTMVILPGLSVQGVMGAASQVAEAYQPMTEDFTIYVFDPRNELPESYSIEEMAENTAAAFEALGLDHVYLMGASMGGMAALEIAAHHPELVEKVVLASASAQMTEEQFQTIDRWITLAKDGDAEALYLDFGEAVYPEEVFEQSREALKEAAKTVTKEELDHFVILAESMRGFDATEELELIKCPVLAISSSDDHVLGADAAAAMEAYMEQRPEWEAFTYDGYGHAAYDLATDFKERMTEFFLKNA